MYHCLPKIKKKKKKKTEWNFKSSVGQMTVTQIKVDSGQQENEAGWHFSRAFTTLEVEMIHTLCIQFSP